MALIKTDRKIERIEPVFDPAGALSGLSAQIDYAIRDDVTGHEEVRVRKSVDIWGQLTAVQKAAANVLLQRVLVITEP